MFWTDCGGSHYSKATVEWIEQNVKLVPEEINPPNVHTGTPSRKLLRLVDSKSETLGGHK